MNHLCIRDLAEIVGGRLRLGCLPPLGGELEPVGRMALDARQVAPSDVFWGLPTANDDGSRQAELAYSHGALGAVVAGRRLEPWAGKFSLEVEDTRTALWRLARAMRRRFTGTLVAVAEASTGSNAKKTIETVLGCRKGLAANVGQPSDDAALALRIAEIAEQERFEVIEMRTGESGQVERLANLCCPHVAVLVGNGEQSSGCDTPTTLAESQVELLAALPEQGWAVVNGDDSGLRRAVGHSSAKIVWFGSGPHCDIYASDIRCRGKGLTIEIDGLPIRLAGCTPADVPAVLAAYAVGRVLQITPRRIATALGRYRPAAPQFARETAREYALTQII